MAFHMKTTLVIDDGVMSRLRQAAAQQNRTISALVEAALRAFLSPPRRTKPRLPKLPKHAMGRARVDIANRQALYDFMDER